MWVFSFVQGCLVAGAVRYKVRQIRGRGRHRIISDLSEHDTLTDAEIALRARS